MKELETKELFHLIYWDDVDPRHAEHILDFLDTASFLTEEGKKFKKQFCDTYVIKR